ncbi:MAG: PAS domain S-box protein [Atribacterota bacterium]
MEQINKPALFLDREGWIQGINEKGTNLLGYMPLDLKGRSFVQFLPSAIQEKAWDYFWKIREGKSERVLLWLRTKEGKEVLVRVTPLFPMPENETGIIFELEDVAKSQSHWLSLYREWQRLRNYLEAVRDIFLILDEEGKVQYINRTGSVPLGFKRKAILGKTLEGFFKDGERVQGELIFRKLREGEPIPERERFIKILNTRGEMRQSAGITGLFWIQLVRCRVLPSRVSMSPRKCTTGKNSSVTIFFSGPSLTLFIGH